MAAERLAEQSDRQLLERLLAGPDEVAFEVLVRRHGPMVYRVCWRVLQHAEDSEDAFQATFLLLARKISSIKKRDSLASWLHGVARRIALEGRKHAARRHRHEARAPTPPEAPPDEITWRELRTVLDTELASLPDKLRLPLLLCYLEGRSQEDAARQLGWSKSTLLRRLEEARTAVGRRLRRKGFVWPAAVSALLVSDSLALAALSTKLIGSTVEAAACALVGCTAAGIVSAKVTALTEGVMNAMFTSKMKSLIFAALLAAVLVGGAGQVARPMFQADPQQSAAPKQPAAVKKPGASPAGPSKSPREPKIVKTDGAVGALAWSPNGKLLAVNQGGRVDLRDPHTGALVKTLIEMSCASMAFTHGGKAVAAGIGRVAGDRPDDVVRIWDIDTGKERAVLKGADCSILTIVCSGDGKLLAAAGVSGNDGGITNEAAVCLWDLASGKLLWRAVEHKSEIYGLAFSPDGKILASGSRDQTIRLWDVEKGTSTRTLEGHGEHGVYSVAFSPKDGKLLASSGLDGTVRLWNAETGEMKQSLTKDYFAGLMVLVAFAPDGKTLASAGDTALTKPDKRQGNVKLWDVETGKLIRTPTTEVEAIYALAFSPNGSTLAVGCWQKKLVLLPTGQ
jgi:RNA polymerase sigma factor (sigma-70 family)